MSTNADGGGGQEEQRVEAFAAAIRDGRRDAVESALAQDLALAATRGPDGVSLVLTAYYHGRPEFAELLLEHRDALDVFEAAASGDLAELRRVLAADPGLVDARSPDGFTPLHLAAFLGRPRAVRVLLAQGADADSVAGNPSAVTPLHSAAASRRADVVRVLLAGGADPDARQAGGFTALQSAALHGDVAMTTALLAHGADPALAAEDGRDALAMARESEAASVAGLLQDRVRVLGPG
ncbi:MAG: ankyrin repeat domain-containing protein [Planctomycetota bacterium]